MFIELFGKILIKMSLDFFHVCTKIFDIMIQGDGNWFNWTPDTWMHQRSDINNFNLKG